MLESGGTRKLLFLRGVLFSLQEEMSSKRRGKKKKNPRQPHKKWASGGCNVTDSARFSDYMPDSLHLLKRRRTDVCSRSRAISFFFFFFWLP